ncbi:hypothetical protein QBC46DRAFT_425492 [Diplogelasinospora grovesii]|uniref:Uncharacterized protein n=1 Tax=Diplogelasinospora grovesii TaxID=303347 RepID=A0AAN6MXT0_9PEZI|nr:hypothetical protein QBC46DRAFT_425492 [Diplogelasinospora grovesii]
MSYQEYAQLGRRNNVAAAGSQPSPSGIASSNSERRLERQLYLSTSSFSVPRRAHLHSSSSSTSTDSTLSPSNSASQKNGNLLEAELGKGAGEKRPTLVDVDLPWRPFCLQRKVLVSFVVILAALVVLLEALWEYSVHHAGLPTHKVGYYLWRLGPTAVLCVLAGAWGRVDYQAKLSAPWIRLSKGAGDAEHVLLLDYVSVWRVVSVVKAAKNRDWVVVCTASVMVLLQLLVVTSTGLVSLAVVDRLGEGIPIALETEFMDNATGLDSGGALAFYGMVGLVQDNVTLPDGVSSTYAYQQFSLGSKLPPESTVRATVDGFTAGLDCETATLGVAVAGVQYSSQNQGVQFNTTVSAAGCNVTLPISSTQFLGNSSGTRGFARLGQGSCGSSTNADDQRLVVVFGTATIDTASLPNTTSSLSPLGSSSPVNGSIPQSVQLLCRPVYNISSVEVVKSSDGTLLSITPMRGQSRNLSNVQPWDIAQAFFKSYDNELANTYTDTTPSFYQPQAVDVDAAMYLALNLGLTSNAGNPVPLESLLNATTLERLVNAYFQQYTALLASASLTQRTTTPATGTADVVGEERLLVSSFATQLIAALLGLSTILAIVAFLLVPRKGLLPRDPGTIMDTAALIANSRGLLQSLRGTGGGDMSVIRDRLRGSEYYTGVEAYERTSDSGSGYFKIFGGAPQASPDFVEQTENFPYPSFLHPLQRLAGLVVVIGLIVTLDLTLQYSGRNGGLADADDYDENGATYKHLLWTIVPTLVLGLLALYLIATDFSIRVLAPYTTLRTGASFEQSMSLNLVDKATPVVLYQSLFRVRNLAVAGASAAVLLASLSLVLGSTLFSAVTIPATASCQVLSQDFFANSKGAPDQNGTVLASLVLDANTTYPPFTYRDLSFPTLALASVPDDYDDMEMGLPDGLIVTATVPAVRPALACRMFNPTEISTSMGSSLQITLAGEANVINITMMQQNLGNSNDTTITDQGFFGKGVYSPIPNGNTTISHWVWVWGQFEPNGTASAVSALACNETLEQVNATINFRGPALNISPDQPPVPDETTVTPYPVTLPDLSYNNLAAVQPSNRLDPFFGLLISSRYGIPLSSLSSTVPSIAQEVMDAIVFQHKIIRTQVVSASSRQPTSDPTVYPATLTVTDLDSGAQRRVVQDQITTRVLQALLASILVSTLTSWLTHPKPNTVLPRPPTSIASLASYLADGNVFGLLGRGAEWQTNDGVYSYFKDGLHVTMGFRLDWQQVRRRRRDQALLSTGLEREVFGISAIRTGGWGGGENVGLGLQARVGLGHRSHVRDWGWRT